MVYRKIFPWVPKEPWTAGHDTVSIILLSLSLSLFLSLLFSLLCIEAIKDII